MTAFYARRVPQGTLVRIGLLGIGRLLETNASIPRLRLARQYAHAPG